MTSVLLVEDNTWLAELEAGILKRAGYDVMVAHHAPAAIQLVDKTRPDVIILDVLLGGSTAFALLHELQSYGDTGVIPVVLCTNMAEQLSADKLVSYGVVRVVDKATMHPDDLIAAVKVATL
ncbi:response regulator [Candidatus Saccharibacteria bacterium]|nr:response regulator [Candidatus Saccharibacteria bacterium]NCS82821.1 response regulator [Candidatus Saccharibacteria bacterium]